MKKLLICGLLTLGVLGSAQANPGANGEAIIKKARCVACHAIDQKRVGPPYQDVAEKYRHDAKAPQHLFDKVRHGGSGHWGDVPMPAHPADKISDEDLKTAIHWILHLKK